MPRMKHLPGLLPQAFSNFLRPSPTLDHGFKVPQQMRPADLAPAGRIPGIGAPAVGHQNATELFPQQLLRHLGPTRQADDKHGDPRRHGHPQPCAGAPFTPARLIKVRGRLRADVGVGVSHRACHGLHRRLFQMGNRPQAHGYPKQVCHRLLGRPLRQAIRPRAQGHDGLHAWPKAPWWHPERQVRAGRHPARRAEQPMQLILRHHRLDRGQLGHLMPVWLGILALQGIRTARALPGLDRDHRIHVLDGHQRPALALMARLSPTLPSTGYTAGAWSQGLGGITRRRLRGVMRVHAQTLQQALDGGLQRCDSRFQRPDIRLRFGWRAFPNFL